jgi:hypothetical protein
MKKLQYSLLILLLLPYSIYATHIVGGEISYSYLGLNQYQFKMTAYRDCYNGIPPFDNPAPIGIFDSSGTLITTIYATISLIQSFNGTDPNCPLLSIPTICTEKGDYYFNATLPPIPGGYNIVYQRCCRNGSITNITNQAATGLSLLSTVPDSINAVNSSPVFTNVPYTYICENQSFSFNNSAIDFDGDSLSYLLCTPLTGGTQADPAPDPPTLNITLVTWENGYSLSNVFGGGSFTIDPVSGILSGVPPSAGLYVFGVCVNEFRNGIYIGFTRRDFQLYVVQSVGVEETDIKNQITIYPSPVREHFILQTEESISLVGTDLIIYNNLGEMISRNEINNHAQSMNLPGDFAPGIYTYELINNGQVFKRDKLIIQ